jgi:hypothetical protein
LTESWKVPGVDPEFWSFTLIVTGSPIVAEVPVDVVTDTTDMLGGAPGVTMIVITWVMPRLTAVTLTLELWVVPDGKETVRVVVKVAPDVSVMLAGLTVAEAPVALMAVVKLIVPAKLFRPFSVTVDVAEPPALTLIGLGLAVIEKSPITTIVSVTRAPRYAVPEKGVLVGSGPATR